MRRFLTFRSLAWGLLFLAAIFVLTGLISPNGLVPPGELATVWLRVWPVLAFLLLIKLASDLLDDAGVFTLLAALLARWSRGRTWVLFVLFCLLSIGATAVLSLDATVVLMTPIAIGLAKRLGVSIMPFLFATIWLANISSLFLPVSNLSNLLALTHSGWSAWEFASRAFGVQLVLLAVVGAVMAVLFRKELGKNYPAFAPHRWTRYDRRPIALLVAAFVAMTAFAVAVMYGVEPWLATIGLDVALLAIRFATDRRSYRVPAQQRQTPSLLALLRAMPWDMAAFALGLFIVLNPLIPILTDVLPTGNNSFTSLLTTGVLGALCANIANNLPAYLALESISGSGDGLLMLLVGVNAGSIITPWASLANLLWIRMASERGVKLDMARFSKLGLVLVPLLLFSGAVTLSR